MFPDKNINHLNEQLRQSLLDQLTDFVIAIDANSHIIFWNQKAQSFFGHQSKDIINQPFTAILASEHFQNVDALLNQIHSQEHWEGDLAFESASNDKIWAFTRVYPFKLNDGSSGRIFQGTTLVEYEIRHHRVQSALDYSQKELSNILSAVGDLVCSYNSQTQNFDFVSPSCYNITGYTEYEMMDAPSLFIDIVKPDFREDVTNALQATSDGEVHRVEYPIVCKQGEERWILNSITPILDDGNTQLICVLTDTTAYRELNELKSRMIRMATHDLNNPLSTAVGFFGLLVDDIADKISTEHQMMIKSIHRSHDRMAKMLEELLDFEQVDSSIKLNRTDVDIIEMVRQLLEQFNFQIQAKRHQVTVETSSDKIITNIDRVQFEHALTNYLSNAIKYTPDGGKIELKLAVENARLIYEVRDNGIGIPDVHREQLFKTFYRAKQPGTENIPGTGLGLSLVKSVIKQHGGDVYYEALTQGSLFGFWIPM